jgi:lipopolysaccharide/colanic/teichoic acid biosynthesis glycosyltransferase
MAMRMKRFIDIVLALLSFVLFAPLMLSTAVAVRIGLGSPILFTQTRPGLHGRPFRMVKFRTMRDAVDRHGRQLPDAQRLTPLGRFLRSTSLDELPEVWNVLVGDMSIVGPRPLLMEYLPLYSPEQARRHAMRPGITGWAQINGRNALDWPAKFALDVWYVDHWSLALDWKIFWLTWARVFRRKGVSAAGEATMPRFTGNPEAGGS